MNFSAFKGIVLAEENLDNSNLTLNRVVSADEKDKLENKGLKFRGFPHKKCVVNGQAAKVKIQTSALFT
jgi:hypothetical protein